MLLGFLHIPSVCITIAAAMRVIGYGYELYKLTKNGGLKMETNTETKFEKVDTVETKINNKCEERTAKVMGTLLKAGNLGKQNPGSIKGTK